MSNPVKWARRKKADHCRNAALVPVLHSVYSGMRFDAGTLEDMRLEAVRRAWTDMAYKVAEWCGEDRIRISNVYSLVPSYFGADTVEDMEFTVGLDLMCGEIVDLGRVIEVIVHEKSIDLLTSGGMVSVMIPNSDTGLDLATQIKLCMRRFGLSEGLPPLRSTGISVEAVRVLSDTAFVYNVDGRPMTSRGLADALGCREDDVADVLNTAEGARMLERVGTQSIRDGGCNLTEEEVMVYNFAEARARRVAQKLGVPISQVRVAPIFGPIRVDSPVAMPLGQINVVCEGVSRSLVMWSARLKVPVRRLAETWEPGLTEAEWVKKAAPLLQRDERDVIIPMWVKG